MNKNTSQDPEYEGLPYHEKKIHKTHFGVVKIRGGNARVKVKTLDGFTFMSQDAAEELGLEIIPQKRSERRKGAEVQVHGEYSGERST